jgi:hypothetical protein
MFALTLICHPDRSVQREAEGPAFPSVPNIRNLSRKKKKAGCRTSRLRMPKKPMF